MEKIDNSINFGSYHSILKTLWKAGKLPTVTRGFYGDVLTRSNVSLDHISIYSQSKRSSLDNFVLSSKLKNHARGSAPIWRVINIEKAKSYLEQFKDVHVTGKFDGNLYIRLIKRKLENLGIYLETGIIKPRYRGTAKIKPHGGRGNWRG